MLLEDITSKKVLIRFDYNVPMNEGKIVNDFRIRQSYETINALLQQDNKLIIASHLGRPTEGKYDPSLSLSPICDYVSEKLNQKIKFIPNFTDSISFDDYHIAMLENVRFNIGEKACDIELSKTLASIADIFVFDAFGVAHRKECSTYGLSDYLDTVAGLNFRHEISTINKLVNEESSPKTIIISGAKVSTKIVVIKKLLEKCDHMILGGGILNTFLKAKGYEIGQSLIEESSIGLAEDILNSDLSSKIFIPTDFTCQTNSLISNIELNHISNTDTIYDLGNKSSVSLIEIINKSSSIFWNGPLGYVEKKPFDRSTNSIANAIAQHNCFSIVGGGDTLPIIENLNLQSDFSCLSTGGGSLLTYIENETLPILDKLNI